MKLVFAVLLLALFATPGTTRDPYIVGGMNAPRGAYPWSAQVISGPRFCGGSLIGRSHVLTAKHCVQYGASTRVVLGDHTRLKPEGSEQTITVSRAILHPTIDIAVLQLSRPAVLNNYVKTIQLASSDPPVSRTVIVSGWGWTRSGVSSGADILQHAYVPIATSSQCRSKGLYLKYHEICAGRSSGCYINVCHGDSGSAMVQRINGVYQQVGVTSRGIARCPPTAKYAVFVSIAKTRNWIGSQIGPQAVNQTTTWTSWYNRDSPSGSGDWELRYLHRPLPCGGKTPLEIQRKTVSTSNCRGTTGFWFLRRSCSSVQVVQMSAAGGLTCQNSRQRSNCKCCDYAVRYKCSV